MPDLLLPLCLIGAYLLGAVPFGLVLTRLAGLGDIREIGSGNIGATNVLRTGRKDLALATLILDAGKGGIAALIASQVFTDNFSSAFAGAAAFLGHCYPVYLGFKGGKGVATFMGTLLAVHPLTALVAGASWLVSALLFRISSLSALIAAIAAPAAAFYFLSNLAAFAVTFMSVLIYWRHRANISRLLAGTEPRIGSSKS